MRKREFKIHDDAELLPPIQRTLCIFLRNFFSERRTNNQKNITKRSLKSLSPLVIMGFGDEIVHAIELNGNEFIEFMRLFTDSLKK